jgi:ketosteroid isomerase-like protein
MTDEALARALEQQDAAIAAMLNGDPRPHIDSLAISDDTTVFGGWGRTEKGHERVTGALRRAGSRFTGADALAVEHTVTASSGDLAYTVGFERSHVSVDGGPLHNMVLRVTHIYRRINGDWKLVHRHADFTPPDQGNPAAE